MLKLPQLPRTETRKPNNFQPWKREKRKELPPKKKIHWAKQRLALVARSSARLVAVTLRHFCVARVALGDIHLDFAWQAWHLWHWAGSGGALGRGWSPRHFCVAGVALGDIHFRFTWQAWLLATSTFVFRGRRVTYGTGLARVAHLGAVGTSPWFCMAGVALMASHRALSHTIFHTPLCHTTLSHHLCHTPSFTQTHKHLRHTPSFTHHLPHAALSHAIFVAHHLCHTPSLSHTIFHTHTHLLRMVIANCAVKWNVSHVQKTAQSPKKIWQGFWWKPHARSEFWMKWFRLQ